MSIYKRALFFFIIALFAVFTFYISIASAQAPGDFSIKQPQGQSRIDLGEAAMVDILNLPVRDITYTLSLRDANDQTIDQITIRTLTNGKCAVNPIKADDSDNYVPLYNPSRTQCGTPGGRGEKIEFHYSFNTDGLAFDRSVDSYTYSLTLSGGAFGAEGVNKDFTVYNGDVIDPTDFQLSFKPSTVTYGSGATASFVITNMRKVGNESIYRIFAPPNPRQGHEIKINDGGCDAYTLPGFGDSWPLGTCTRDDKGGYTYTSTITIDSFSDVQSHFNQSSDDHYVVFNVSMDSSSGKKEDKATLTITGKEGARDTQCNPKDTKPSCPLKATCEPVEDGSDVGKCTYPEGEAVVIKSPLTDSANWPIDESTCSNTSDPGSCETIPMVPELSAMPQGTPKQTFTINGVEEERFLLSFQALHTNPGICYAVELQTIQGQRLNAARYGLPIPNIYNGSDGICKDIFWNGMQVDTASLDRPRNVFEAFKGLDGPVDFTIPVPTDGAYKVVLHEVSWGQDRGCYGCGDDPVAEQKFIVGTGVLPGAPIPPCRELLVEDTAENATNKYFRIRVTSNTLEDYEKLFGYYPNWRFVKCTEVPTAIGAFRTDPREFVEDLMAFLLSISGAIAIILIIRSGYIIMMSRADPEKIQQAREILTSAIVGLLFLIFSLVILEVIGVDVLKLPGFCRDGAATCAQRSGDPNKVPPPLPNDVPELQPDEFPEPSPEHAKPVDEIIESIITKTPIRR